MKIKLEDPTLLTKVIEIISDLVVEVKIKVNSFGMSIVAIDPANVAMVSFKLPKSSFSEFEADDENLGINLDDFKKILKRAGVRSVLTLSKEKNTLIINIDDRIKRNFSLALLNLDSEDKEIPNLSFTSNVEINSEDFVSSIEDCSVVSDSCSFEVQDGTFVIESKGMNSSQAIFTSNEAKINSENSKAKYSLEYLQKFLKGAKLCEKTSLNFAENHPLRIDFNKDEMELGFILAPRVETD